MLNSLRMRVALTSPATSDQAAAHLWSPSASLRVFDLVGYPPFPGIAKLQQLAAEGLALMQTAAWQQKALAWHVEFEHWCAQFNLPNPPTWYGVHVAYRPFWWRVDVADVLAHNVNPWADAFLVDPFDHTYEIKKAKDWATIDFHEVMFAVGSFAIGSLVLGGFVGAAFGALGTSGQFGAALETATGTALEGGLGSEIAGGSFADGFEQGLEGAVGDLAGAAGNEIVGEIADAAGVTQDTMNDWLNNAMNGWLGGVVGGITGIFGSGSAESTPGITPGSSSPTLNLGGAEPQSTSNDQLFVGLALLGIAVALWA